jgi:hypothetical protein
MRVLTITLRCLAIALGLGLAACTTTRPQKLRLHAGEIKEVTLRAPADTSRRLLATSENPEVVDVSRKQAVAEGITPGPNPAGSQIYLVKGVTAGTVRVVFSEKQPGEEGQGRVRRTYRVEVVNE